MSCALEHTGSLFRAFLESSADLLLILDESHLIVEGTRTALRMFGQKVGERFRAVADSGPDCVEALVRETFKQGRASRHMVLRSALGVPAELDVNLFRCRHEGRDVVVFEAMLKACREDLERTALSLAVKHSDDIVVFKDPDLRVVATTMAFARASGHASPDDLVGKTDAEIFGVSPDAEPVRSYMADERLAQSLPPGEALVREEPVILADGRTRCVLTRKFPVHDENGKLLGTANISTDITERKELEQRLREERNRYELLFSLVPCAIFTVDEAHRITSWNRMAETLTGYSSEESLGRSCHLFAMSPYRENCDLACANVPKPVLGRMCEIQRKDGTVISIKKNLAELVDPKTSAVVGGIETFEDVTKSLQLEREKSEAQAQLIHSMKLASIGTLAGGVAHEINNPLSIIVAVSEYLARDIPWTERQKHATKIRDAVERIVRIVKALRTYARADDDVVEPVDVASAIASTLSLMEPLCRNDQVRLEAELPSSSLNAKANPGKLQQVLMNLLTNARDAVVGRREQRRIDVKTVARDGWVEIAVSDNGCGIDAATLPRIFDPFFTTKPVGKGTGLGLSISQAIVESFGGKLSVSSSVGAGSTFTIELPLFEEDFEPSPQDAHAVQKRYEGVALVVDDESDVREALVLQLRELGLEVMAVGEGQEALALCGRRRFDFLFTDLKMPGMRGERLIEELARGTGGEVPWVVVVTGCVEMEPSGGTPESWRSHVRRVLTKPFTLAEIGEILEEAAEARGARNAGPRRPGSP